MPRILLIDDNAELRELLRIVLKRAGYEVEDASDGDEGMERFRKTPADLVITDILMPHSGLEAIVELARDFPQTKLIAMSAGFRKTESGDDELARTLGVARALPKPFDPADLIRVVNEVLGEAPPTGPGK